jgi:hypothetical protein
MSAPNDHWYESANGTVTRCYWAHGRLCAVQTVDDWTAVPSRAEQSDMQADLDALAELDE